MDFEFFAGLSEIEARQFLDHFLTVESKQIQSILGRCASEGVRCDYSVESIAPLLQCVLTQISVLPKEGDDQVPDWIRTTETYVKNLFEFDNASKHLILGAAFYVGQSLVQTGGNLHWSVGATGTAEEHMPVVTGFRNRIELAPLLVVENLFGRVITDPTKLNDISTAIDYWSKNI